jgi:NhaP-type Na+/H+ and K+/H+ antiporter
MGGGGGGGVSSTLASIDEKMARRFEVGERVELHGLRFRVAALDGRNLVLEVGVARAKEE